MRYTDPTGHTISDVLVKVDQLAKVLQMLEVAAAVFLLYMPLAILGGPWGLAFGLIFFMIFLMIAAMAISLIGEILQLLTDSFDHYQDGQPEGPPGDLDECPDEECPFQNSDDSSSSGTQMLDGLNPSDSLNQQFDPCGCEFSQAEMLAILLDVLSLTLAITLTGFLGIGCALGGAGCLAMLMLGVPATNAWLGLSDWFGIVSGVTCLDDGGSFSPGNAIDSCPQAPSTWFSIIGAVGAIGPLSDALVDWGAVQYDIQHLNSKLQECGY